MQQRITGSQITVAADSCRRVVVTPLVAGTIPARKVVFFVLSYGSTLNILFKALQRRIVFKKL